MDEDTNRKLKIWAPQKLVLFLDQLWCVYICTHLCLTRTKLKATISHKQRLLLPCIFFCIGEDALKTILLLLRR